MKTEEKCHLYKLGEIVRQERKKRDMNQIDFYKFLFPDNDYNDENIKKKMNALENGKNTNANYELLFALHDKCELSMDYLFGFETKYPNYENKEACTYTGLSTETIQSLHTFSSALHNSIPEPDAEMSRETFIERDSLISKKNEAAWILKMIDLLFYEDNSSNKNPSSNLKILHDLYMLSVAIPKAIWGTPEDSSDEVDDLGFGLNNSIPLVSNSLVMTDTFGGARSIDINKIHRQIWKDCLVKDLDVFIEKVRKEAEKQAVENSNKS